MEYRTKEIHHFFYFHVAIIYVTRRNKRISQLNKICLLPVKRKYIYPVVVGYALPDWYSPVLPIVGLSRYATFHYIVSSLSYNRIPLKTTGHGHIGNCQAITEYPFSCGRNTDYPYKWILTDSIGKIQIVTEETG